MLIFPQRQQTKTIALWIEEFERDYFTRRARTPKSLATWTLDYLKVFSKLPLEEPLTSGALTTLAVKPAPDTRTRKRYCLALGALAKFAKLEGVNLKPYAGKYSPSKATPRDLPDDATIVQWHSQILAEDWRWAYGMLATYGLRNHELFHLDYQRLRSGNVALKVLDGKTGSRLVFPFYPEWFDQFDLRTVVLPKATGRNNADLGHRVSQAFRRLKLPFRAYDLRHSWAVRTMEFGLEPTLAAQQMGHSLAVHTSIYHAWITERQQQRMFNALMHRTDRPKPPE